MKPVIQHTNPLLPDYFSLHGKWRARRPALIASGIELSWSEFTARLNQVGNGLHAAGLKKGDRVIVFMSNGAAMAEALFGIMMGGLVSAPLNLSVSDEAIINMVADSDAKAIIVTQDQAERIAKILPNLPAKARRLMLVAEGDHAGFNSFEAWRDTQATSRPKVKIKPDDFISIIYSSGTTGRPKGIIQTHQGRRDWAYDMANALRYNSASRFLAVIGLYSNITWVGMLSALLSGGTLLISRSFSPETLWAQIERDRVTHMAMVPVMYERLMDVPDHLKFDVSHMQGLMSAGSPLRPAIREKLFARFPCGITELYGLTEGVITTLDPEDAQGRMSSVGVPILGSDLVILGSDDAPCAAGTPGEICMASRFVMPGYLNRKSASLESRYVDKAGQHWLRTGDIGYLDEEGYLYIVDRKKDMILSGGQNIYPQDIEAVMTKHPDIMDVAVIGVPSGKWGETPLAVIVPANGKVDTQQLTQWTNTKVGKQQRISGIKIVEEIPRNPNGKILKRNLKDRFGDIYFD